ncbi:unnamed protein product [Cylicostephanus goldi]|uniref:Uncharacterized protein n=1 Tax=Cylicostephanus goldi TaxID=71465 RepID=A0A3P6TH08_CYLGO|nr:unnamed protein product [Cylicostephanus goldi]
MLDYSRLMGYNTPTAVKSVSIETNRVYDTNAQEAGSSKNSPYRAENSRITVDNRGVVRSGGSNPSNRRITSGHSGETRMNEEETRRDQDRGENLEEGKEEKVNEKEEHPKTSEKEQKSSDWEIGSSTISQRGEHEESAAKEGEKVGNEQGSVASTTRGPKLTTWHPHGKVQLNEG